MRRLYFFIFIICVLSGCSHDKGNTSVNKQQKNTVTNSVISKHKATVSSSYQANDNLSQCNRELAALERFDHASWIRSRAEFEKITKSSAAYMDVADTISHDINDMVRPKYQYALRSFCWRVRNDLFYALVHSVKINDSNR